MAWTGSAGFVGRRTVRTGDGDVEQTQVNAQLGAVVDQVIHEKTRRSAITRGREAIVRSPILIDQMPDN